MGTDIKQRIEAANAKFLRRMTLGDPVLVDVAPAGEVVPGMEDRMILHSGPPVDWEHMCGAQKGACIGITLFEGWARDKGHAEELLRDGRIALEPNHHHQAVGPMAGTITRSVWVFVVENRGFGNRAFCRQVEGRQQFGDYSDDALDGLIKWRDVWASALQRRSGTWEVCRSSPSSRRLSKWATNCTTGQWLPPVCSPTRWPSRS